MKRARVEESARVLRSSAMAKCDELAEDVAWLYKNGNSMMKAIEELLGVERKKIREVEQELDVRVTELDDKLFNLEVYVDQGQDLEDLTKLVDTQQEEITMLQDGLNTLKHVVVCNDEEVKCLRDHLFKMEESREQDKVDTRKELMMYLNPLILGHNTRLSQGVALRDRVDAFLIEYKKIRVSKDDPMMQKVETMQHRIDLLEGILVSVVNMLVTETKGAKV